jgi:hypothetical protein
MIVNSLPDKILAVSNILKTCAKILFFEEKNLKFC